MNAVSNTPWWIQREINDCMCYSLTATKVDAAVNGHTIYVFQV